MCKATVLGMPVDVTDLNSTISSIENLLLLGTGAYVCVSNVHMCMEFYDDASFQSVLKSADLVLPDGRPIFWAQRFLGHSNASQVRGQDIMEALCEKSSRDGLRIGLYGGSSAEVLDTVMDVLRKSYPGVDVVYAYSPPFRELTVDEDIKVVRDICESKVDVLFVGIGCPKQERWMMKHKNDLNCVMLGVGAAYDFIAGTKQHAPRFIQYLGFEWLFRLLSEPRRLWKRYLIQNPRFVYHFFAQLILKNDSK